MRFCIKKTVKKYLTSLNAVYLTVAAFTPKIKQNSITKMANKGLLVDSFSVLIPDIATKLEKLLRIACTVWPKFPKAGTIDDPKSPLAAAP